MQLCYRDIFITKISKKPALEKIFGPYLAFLQNIAAPICLTFAIFHKSTWKSSTELPLLSEFHLGNRGGTKY